MFDVGRSMFDVQSFHCSRQAEFHTRFQVSGVKVLIIEPPVWNFINSKVVIQVHVRSKLATLDIFRFIRDRPLWHVYCINFKDWSWHRAVIQFCTGILDH